MQIPYKDNDIVSFTLILQRREIGVIHFKYGDRPTKEKFTDMVMELVKSDSPASIQPCECVRYFIDEAREGLQRLQKK